MPTFLAMPLILLAMLVLIATLPVALPIVAAMIGRDKQRRRACAGATRCSQCGQVLGTAALDASDDANRSHVEDLRRRCPNHLLRMVRHAHARCTQCGANYAWDSQVGILTRLSDCAGSA